MSIWKRLLFGLLLTCVSVEVSAEVGAQQLQVAFGETDITPKVAADETAVWLAGYGQGRRATKVHDPLLARAVLLDDGAQRIALVSVDLVGLQYPVVQSIRERLDKLDYVLVSSTHNHEGPDVIGIWGASPTESGVEKKYLDYVANQVVQLVQQIQNRLQPADVLYGEAENPDLVRDSRLPIVKDAVIRVLSFRSPSNGKTLGTLVQWSCHPEAMGSRNTELTADFPAATVQALKEATGAPVAYFTGAVGGLMTPPRDDVVKNDQGEPLREGDFAYTWRYGQMVAELAEKALRDAQPFQAVPLKFSSEQIALPVDNPMYKVAWTAGVLQRPAIVWQGDATLVGPAIQGNVLTQPMAVATEVACVAMGELRIACIPGELYPELVYGAVPDPAEAGADFPDADVEANIRETIGGPKWLIIGLANDEIGYLIPRRQWDRQPPYCYGRNNSQYGEVNSCSPNAAQIIMSAFQRVVKPLNSP